MEIFSLNQVTSLYGTTNNEHRTLNTEHGTLNTEHGTQNTEHGTLNTEHGTLNTEHGTRNSSNLKLQTLQTSTSNSVASLGIRQSPLGERLMDPTFGPSGMHERLNCWAKNL